MIRRAMVLAAGRGQRLAPLTDTLPKPLMPVGGVPLLEHILAFLRAGGIEDVVVNLHHLGHLIEERIGDGGRFGLHVRYSREDPILDTGGGIKHAERLLAGEPFVVANGDSLLELPLRDVIAAHEARRGVVTMVLRPRTPAESSFGMVDVDRDDRVRRIVGLPAVPARPDWRGFTFPGLHVLDSEVFAHMDADAAFSITRDTYTRLLVADRPIYAYVSDARWLTIDTPAALASADAAFRAAPFRWSASLPD